jgi:hypothetical protein
MSVQPLNHITRILKEWQFQTFYSFFPLTNPWGCVVLQIRIRERGVGIPTRKKDDLKEKSLERIKEEIIMKSRYFLKIAEPRSNRWPKGLPCCRRSLNKSGRR